MESLRQQYSVVKDRTSAHETYNLGSHVMQCGDIGLNDQSLYLFMGTAGADLPSGHPGHVPGHNSAVYRNSGDLPWWLWLLQQPEFVT
ncbi:hypothetical protein QYE76_005065 [Lolium multiflorum]|uniref:Uncharacterized protein n=1 Tax=Lolium multiflorum TaxID=4521 RepID=A0AAD8W0D2_LOLMU|nr:hypothetical protein QYE76_005065 [Lolium multiflorum]